ncbi:MAG: uncharacterized protein QOJ32_1229 [Frankiaceae bacterium]|jgi:uncharacterized membrane protein YfcA|nr:uncharacterized protein [Frankiaceae bacterium]MDQ1634420.1 uncharacterized protein [Frankiaceae bacterium]MDQ1673621.1 uncharacterized protein [Frankiaceae bacterium]
MPRPHRVRRTARAYVGPEADGDESGQGRCALTPLEALATVAAGFGAGTINTIVGSGTLLTFPTLLAIGYSPLVANVSNTVGLVPGVVGGVWGYRNELKGQRARLLRLGSASVAGGLTGGILLLVRPDAFRSIVPYLVIAAALLMGIQPLLTRKLRERLEEHADPRESKFLLPPLTYATGIYGGYFGAAQGVVLLAVMGMLVDDDLQRLNATKNVLAGLVNGVAAALFIVFSSVAWEAAGLLALGSIVGGALGAVLARRIPSWVLRIVVVVVGVTVGVILLLT